MNEINRDQVIAYAADCGAGGRSETSIKRRLGALGAVLNGYHKDHDVSQRNPFHRVPIDKEQVVTFDTYLRDATGLWPRTTGLLWSAKSSSFGPSKAAELEPVDIILEHDVPHVVVRPNSLRDFKVKSRQRFFPLVGKTLEHLSAIPGGAFNASATSVLTHSSY